MTKVHQTNPLFRVLDFMCTQFVHFQFWNCLQLWWRGKILRFSSSVCKLNVSVHELTKIQWHSFDCLTNLFQTCNPKQLEETTLDWFGSLCGAHMTATTTRLVFTHTPLTHTHNQMLLAQRTCTLVFFSSIRQTMFTTGPSSFYALMEGDMTFREEYKTRRAVQAPASPAKRQR